MAKNRIIASIELGSSKICTLIAQVQTDANTFQHMVNIVGVSSVESVGIKKGQIVNIEEAVEATIASVEAAERMAGYNLDSAYLSLGGASIVSQNSHGVVAVSTPDGEITVNDVDRVIEAASAVSLPSSRELIHVIPREFTVDGENGVKDPVGMSGVRLEVDTHIVTASSSSVKNIKKAINEVGINIEDLVFNGIAASEAVLTSTEKELGCVVVDIGGGTTSITAFSDGAIAYSGVIPIGARNVTNDLAIGLRVSLESAEKIKISLSKDVKKQKEEDDNLDLSKDGISEVKKVSKKTLIEGIIRPRLNEIFSMVRLELDKVGLTTRIPSGVVVTGGGAETVGIIESAKRTLSLPVRIGIPKGVGGLIDDIENPLYAVPVGLILYGAREEPQESNTSFAKRIKIPGKGIAGKIIEAIKDLLP
ncbi:cell division protein FtsA [Candidatus Woesebacteria bacterium RBG_16_36_11]|uniref:Cell division protein FtsA n=3 Tax=Candidatus Woeseibacteriota TaxID=1752722 RepID=A0A1F7XA88_9BACT|nr:MAG: cell division protein FtsA [Candidatus Woesebacteria bacterium RBG_13_36_22]OGM11689.1 MAG: cell division protein FtsA [Candidatus Woesebacteria bacterium RBG_16_36_11]OGM17415.1 MAG: cell division protein FtsA [Candidatus Woesebacteria bacterium RBG_19FT_COMBO_37_29]